MTTDDFVERLSAEWHSQTVYSGDLASKVRARQSRVRGYLLINLLTVAALGVLAVLFMFAAFYDGNALYGIAGAAFLLGLPVALFEFLDLQRTIRFQFDASPEGMLVLARSQAMTARRQLRSCRWSALLLAGASLAAWGLVRVGLADYRKVLIISLCWIIVAALSWIWQFRRDQRLVAEIDSYDSMLISLNEANRDFC